MYGSIYSKSQAQDGNAQVKIYSWTYVTIDDCSNICPNDERHMT